MRIKNIAASVMAVCLLIVSAGAARGGTVKFRVDVEVTHAFTGLPVGTTGSVFVEYEDTLTDMDTTRPHHQKFGLYGYPEIPGVKMLWDFGGEDVIYNEQGAVAITDAPFVYNSDAYAVFTNENIGDVEGVTKGIFAGWTFWSGVPLRLLDHEDAMVSGPELIPPDASFIGMAEGDLNSGGVQFAGNSAFFADKATNIVLLNAALDYNAAFTAGSPASISQAIMTPGSPFAIGFDYRFDAAAVSGGGFLKILLDGILLDQITASNAGTTQSTVLNVSNPLLLGQSALDLIFEYDGPTGSQMFLDNVSIPGSDLLNGNFQTQTLSAWGTAGAGTVGAMLAPAAPPGSGGGGAVPLPGAAGMGLAMLAAMGALLAVRRSRMS